MFRRNFLFPSSGLQCVGSGTEFYIYSSHKVSGQGPQGKGIQQGARSDQQEQETLGRINLLLSFDTTRTEEKTKKYVGTQAYGQQCDLVSLLTKIKGIQREMERQTDNKVIS
jgi:hypothetical protein